MAARDEIKKLLWKELEAVALIPFRNEYQPLVTLKLTKKGFLGPATSLKVRVWKNSQAFSAFEPCTAQPLKLPQISRMCPLQKLSVKLNSHRDVSATLELLGFKGGAAANSTASTSYDLEFYSEGVAIGDVQEYLSKCKAGPMWDEITRHAGSQKCGIVTEVFYGRRVAVEASSSTHVNIHAGAAAGTPGSSGAPAAGHLEGTVGSEATTQMSTGNFEPFGFKYVIVKAPETKWDVSDGRWATNAMALPDEFVGEASSAADSLQGVKFAVCAASVSESGDGETGDGETDDGMPEPEDGSVE